VWSFDAGEAGVRSILRFAIHRGPRRATYAEVIGAWIEDSRFRTWFDELLAGVPFSAFRWETPAVTESTVQRAFELVLIDSPELLREAEPLPFREHFERRGSAHVVEFSNLGGDAILVVPCPIGESSAYAHLGAFVRNAPEPQRSAFWQAVGDAMKDRLGEKPVWLSTAGDGVAWLHVRLDDRPKYYRFAPFRALPVV
jgi:hypothetical protein